VQDPLAAKRDLRLEAWKSRNRETGEVRRPHHRGDGIRAAKSRGDGARVHTVGGASNLPFPKWEGIFKDAMTTAAAIDRLVHDCVILELNIPSYRMEQAKKNRDAGLESAAAK
jgi:hypothetical protein